MSRVAVLTLGGERRSRLNHGRAEIRFQGSGFQGTTCSFPNIFEDNEEEEGESEEEEESFGQALGPAGQGRGRGRGIMWPLHMPRARGARPMPGMQGFPPVMLGADGFSYGAVPPNGFAMSDVFGMGLGFQGI